MSAALNASGRSIGTMWPASGMTTRSAPGMSAAVLAERLDRHEGVGVGGDDADGNPQVPQAVAEVDAVARAEGAMERGLVHGGAPGDEVRHLLGMGRGPGRMPDRLRLFRGEGLRTERRGPRQHRLGARPPFGRRGHRSRRHEQAGDAIRVRDGEGGGDHPAQREAGEHDVVGADLVEEGDEIGDVVVDRPLRRGLVGGAHAAEVGRDDPPAPRRHRRDLMAPYAVIPAETVDEQHRPAAGLTRDEHGSGGGHWPTTVRIDPGPDFIACPNYQQSSEVSAKRHIVETWLCRACRWHAACYVRRKRHFASERQPR